MVMILDSHCVKNATGATVGSDADKLVKCHKYLVLTDVLGNVMANCVLPANAAASSAAIDFWDEVTAAHDLVCQVQVVFVDSSFNSVFQQHLAQRLGIRVEKPTHVLVKNKFLHSCSALDCRAHVCLARRQP